MAKQLAAMLIMGLWVSVVPCCQWQPRSIDPDIPAIISDGSHPRPPFDFSDDDEAFLEEIQRGSFNFLWNEIDISTGMVLDRTGAKFISIAGVGYQLGSICVADERGWITRKEAHDRALLILRSLHGNDKNRPNGIFFHFLAPGTAGPSGGAYEQVASTIDSAILFSGMLTASAHFGGEIAELADEMVAEANWQAYIDAEHERPYEHGFLSLGWEKPDEPGASFEDGLLSYTWADAGDEQRLTAFIAMCSPIADHRAGHEAYYNLRRTLGDVPGEGKVVWFPWSGALFTAFFANCWIDYAAMPADDPSEFKVQRRVGVDWWENSRRTVQLHRQRAAAVERPFTGFGENVWGLSACDGEDGYIVPGHFPELSDVQAGEAQYDHLTTQADDNWCDGTVAPYAAGCAILFDPEASVAALRNYRAIAETTSGLWDDPAAGGYGFADSFRLSASGEVEWVAADRVSIDAGPLLIAIENARSGFVWKTFGSHAYTQAAQRRLGLNLRR